MKGPIDFIIIGFEGNNFDGSILKAISGALDKGTIGLVALALVSKSPNGTVRIADAADPNNVYVSDFARKYKVEGEKYARIITRSCPHGSHSWYGNACIKQCLSTSERTLGRGAAATSVRGASAGRTKRRRTDGAAY
jgi:hypothetical protein